MATIIEESKEIKLLKSKREKNKVGLKIYFNKAITQTVIDSKECDNVPFKKVEKPVSKEDEYEKLVDYLSIDYCSLLPAISKMQELY